MLAKGPQESRAAAAATGEASVNRGESPAPSRPSLPEISSSPFELNYRWPSPSASSASPSKSADKDSTTTTTGSPSSASGEGNSNGSKRSAVKSVFRSVGSSFSLGHHHHDGLQQQQHPTPSVSPSKFHDRDHPSFGEGTVPRRSLAMERSQSTSNALDFQQSSQDQQQHAEENKKSRRKSVAILGSSAVTPPASNRPLPHVNEAPRLASSDDHHQLSQKASSQNVASLADTADSAHDDDVRRQEALLSQSPQGCDSDNNNTDSQAAFDSVHRSAHGWCLLELACICPRPHLPKPATQDPGELLHHSDHGEFI